MKITDMGLARQERRSPGAIASLNANCLSTSKESKNEQEDAKNITTGIKPLQPQIAQPTQLQQSENGWQRLATQAQLINQLSKELETAMFELKAIATQISCQQRLDNKPRTKTCQFAAAIVPNVKRNKAGEFLLTSRTVDLFRAEREATELAQTLRQWANKNKHRLN